VPERRAEADHVVIAEIERSHETRVRADLRPGADDDVLPDDGVGPDLDAFAEARARLDDGGLMDAHAADSKVS
jgi:hypothetical protein